MIQVEAPQTEAAKDAAIEKAVAEINKEHGKNSILTLGHRVGVTIPHIPTGIYSVDKSVLGCGGLPKGRIVEIFGAPSGGKTTIALMAIANAQRTGGRAAFIDAECAFGADWAAILGVDVDNLLVSQPDYGEQALKIVETLLESRALDIIVVDSVAALIPKAELDGEIGDAHMALQARMMSQAMRKLTSVVSSSGTCLVFLNQTRTNLGITYGSNEVTTGGKALQFYSSVRLSVKRIGQVKQNEEIIGNKTKIAAVKNKVGAPFREAEIDLLFDRGFDRVGNLIDIGVERKVISKAGAWFNWSEQKFQGKEALRSFITEDDARYEALLAEVHGGDDAQ
jgi:recombination protein RecA